MRILFLTENFPPETNAAATRVFERACYWAKWGHEVTVFEKEDRVGGLLMYGIPNMKLEKSILDMRIDLMRQEGIKFFPNMDVGSNSELNYLETITEDLIFWSKQ